MGLSEFASRAVDPYELKARLTPSLLAVAPIAINIACQLPSNNRLGTVLVSTLAACGAAYALGRAARDSGKKLEPELFAKWGGPPTTQLFRHRNTEIEAITKHRYHSAIAKSLGRTAPSESDERADPAAADAFYAAATTWLRSQTRDVKAYPLVFKENIAYGFQRNALGLRRVGVVTSLIGTAWAAAVIAIDLMSGQEASLLALSKPSGAHLAPLAASLGLLWFWATRIGEPSARRTAFAYAHRLLESCDRVAQSKVPTPRKRASTTSKSNDADQAR